MEVVHECVDIRSCLYTWLVVLNRPVHVFPVSLISVDFPVSLISVDFPVSLISVDVFPVSLISVDFVA